jgi:signal transduction histidine kinase
VIGLTATPRLWETNWFRVTGTVSGAGLLASGVLLGARRRYHRKLERLQQQRALERERARIAQDLHDDLGAGLVEISFGSELAQDTALSQEEAREHSREIGVRAREMVTALDEIVWAVNPRHDSVVSLATYFCQFTQHFLKSTPVRCHLEVAKDLPAAPLDSEQRHSLFLAFKEAVCNVVQHASASDLWLTISVENRVLTVVVRDNGRGLNLSCSREPVGADGLENMRGRLRRLGGSCELASSPGEGTAVTLKVPLKGVGGDRDNSIEVL